MSVTLATIAEALIEFILSLLRDPDAAAEFEDDPHGALSARGLSHVSAADVAAVTPVIVERTTVVPHSNPHGGSNQAQPSSDPVVREINNVVQNFAWIDDSDTIVDQSVNQNIWADGDVTQVFDQEAVVASGDEAIAAGEDVSIEQTEDNSTTITAGNDAVVGNETTETVVEDSYNETTDTSTTTDASTDVVVEESFTDESTTVAVEDSFTDTSTAEPAEPAETAEDVSYDSSATTYTETAAEADANAAFETTETAIVVEPTSDDEF
ncbi:IniB N-terminal domain-containing protein [Microbacterium sulfonylureivorans]|uniref:IniB N-terminal domain-containing protein n=1 Tax=Microbacterium sulfonylureivorans TaxID=2486854 RepID=UPI000FD83513|nr:IniB N-terminal domain-containing protein [Microbacterium sulfonylureivorans]